MNDLSELWTLKTIIFFSPKILSRALRLLLQPILALVPFLHFKVSALIDPKIKQSSIYIHKENFLRKLHSVSRETWASVTVNLKCRLRTSRTELSPCTRTNLYCLLKVPEDVEQCGIRLEMPCIHPPNGNVSWCWYLHVEALPPRRVIM